MRRLVLLSLLILTACAPSLTTPAPTLTPPSTLAPAAVPGTVAPSITETASTVPTEAVTNFPAAESYQWKVVASGFAHPLDIQNAGDGSGRLFIVQQGGRIRILENGQMLDPPFLDIIGRVGSVGNEQGLLGMAFDPNFKQNQYFYVNYTELQGNTVIARFTASGNVADPNSELKLLGVAQPFPNHNGGGLAFGPDGYFYIGLGDGGSQGDPNGNGQNLNTLLGKLLRIDVKNGAPYAIPPDNPFANGGSKPEIWAYGLRNPWRFSFDRATGDLWIGDVGQDLWEEIDFLPAGTAGGVNFGWNCYEGMHDYSAGAQIENYRPPLFEYSHSEGCSVTGGYIYRGSMPEWQGVYFYGDYCSGGVWGALRVLDANGETSISTRLFETGAAITSFGVDESGEIYLADRNGNILRLERR
jgi:glucose/arabinose dehydrogenase